MGNMSTKNSSSLLKLFLLGLISLPVCLSSASAEDKAEPTDSVHSDDCANGDDAPKAEGEENNDDSAEHLFGSWGGLRPALNAHGINVQSVLTQDLMANVHGGLKRGAPVLWNYDLTAEVNTEKAGLWKGGTLFFYVLANWGKTPSEYIGDTQVTSNIEAPDSIKLYEAFIDQSLVEDKVSLLLGLYNYNSEFDVLSYASTLINSSFGISKEGSQVGPSIFPTTSVAARLKLTPTDHTYYLTTLYDGVPGDEHTRGTHIHFQSGDGLFWGNEVGMNSTEEEGADKHYKVGLGYWYHTKRFDDYQGLSRTSNYGLYLISEAALWSEEDKNQGLGAFFTAGYAQSDRNFISHYVGGGLSYTGLIPNRDEDVTALGFASARLADDFRSANEGLSAAETTLEFDYRAKVFPYLTLQPDVQYVIRPSGSRDVGNALVLSVRMAVAM